MSSTVIGHTKDGREVRRLVEFQPLRFIHPPQPTLRRTREPVAVDDFGTVEGSTQPMKTHGHNDALAALADEGVPVAGYADRLPSGGMLGVEVEFPSRRASGRDLTHALLEAGDVPLVPPARKRGGAAEEGTSLAGSNFARGAEDEDGGETWASAEDGEAGEDEGAEDGEDPEEDPEDAWASFVQEVSESTDTAAKGLALLARALRQRRAAIGAAGGLFD